MNSRVIPPLIAAMGLVAIATYLVSARRKGKAAPAAAEELPKPETMNEAEVTRLAVKAELAEDRSKIFSEYGKKGVEARRKKKAEREARQAAAAAQAQPVLLNP